MVLSHPAGGWDKRTWLGRAPPGKSLSLPELPEGWKRGTSPRRTGMRTHQAFPPLASGSASMVSEMGPHSWRQGRGLLAWVHQAAPPCCLGCPCAPRSWEVPGRRPGCSPTALHGGTAPPWGCVRLHTETKFPACSSLSLPQSLLR